ncbi:hypothetical protein [Pantoea ananatis]|uniref:hypothetical protein n=1 Tax=Pantoea ananas TaxID=553 RepID=UPI001B3188B5|nr:hypothetical protein [Pantoea ananatis]
MKNSVITDAMFSCIEGYIPEVWSSIEFELQRPLSDDEKNAVADKVTQLIEQVILSVQPD